MNNTIWEPWEKIKRDENRTKPGYAAYVKSLAECSEDRGGVRCPCSVWKDVRKAFPLAPSHVNTSKKITIGPGNVIQMPARKKASRLMAIWRCARAAIKAGKIGDFISCFATPVARKLGLSCIDEKNLQLKPDSPCAQRKAALNKLTT